jgi:acetate CoA/acetoacetate CoA-transferase alpha subunit
MGGPGSKLASRTEVAQRFRDGMTVMVGGFMGVGAPAGLVQALLASEARDLTLIVTDTASPATGIGPAIVQRRFRRVLASHIGTNPETGRQMLAGELEVELIPQGTLAERIRCGGAGLGGVLTPTGVGTSVARGKTVVELGGVEYLLERPLRADIALVKAARSDRAGNLVYERAARNFNPLMAMAADLVVAEVDELVEVGALDPEVVVTPSVLVDLITLAKEASP